MKKYLSTLLIVIILLSSNITHVDASNLFDSYGKTNIVASSNTAKVSVSSSKKILTVKEIAKKNTGVVLITAYNKNNEIIGTGSGFIISQSGKLITNYHVINNATSVIVKTSNKRNYKISYVLGYSSQLDIAILQINSNDKFQYLTLGNSDKVELGESVVAIGSPLGLQNTVSTGIISNINSGMFRDNIKNKDIQISAPISHGSSGGALFNMYGEVIGITYAGLAEAGGENLNFVIPINDYKKISLKTSYTLQKVYENEHVIYYSDAKYEGQLINGIPNGLGVLTWDIGDVYVGYFVDGVRCGQGKYWWKNGNVAEGEWSNNQLNGEGVFTWADGSNYIGDFVDSLFDGEGSLKNKDSGITYSGPFKKNMRDGIGTLIYEDGTLLTGTWSRDNLLDGEVLITYPNGKSEYLKWSNGQLITNYTSNNTSNSTNNNVQNDIQLTPFKDVLKEIYKNDSLFLSAIEDVILPSITETSQRHRDKWISTYDLYKSNSIGGSTINGIDSSSVAESIAISSAISAANKAVINMK